MKIETINENVSIIERADGFHSIITIPMYPPFKDYLFTRDLNVARAKALENYNRYQGV